jgi:hypothetical protein
MGAYELRDLEQARRFVLQGLWWQRVTPPSTATVREVLEWAREASSSGEPLPPLGFIGDVGHAAFGPDLDERGPRGGLAVPGLPINLARTYEDHVLGKLYADWTFARAGDALRRYQGRDRARGLAFFLRQFRQRAGFGGVEFSPGVLQSALEAAPEDVLGQGWESLRQDGPLPLLIDLYESLIAAARRTAEVLGQEDLFELERGTALHEEGGRLARRQVLRAAALFEAALPRRGVRPRARRMEVPTHILDEDTYPVGGFTSLSNRGSVESLLHSQLAYMETDAEARPDLFDVKFLRDELLYYARDENQFLRRRRSFVFALSPELISARYMDPGLPYQRGVLLLALLLTAVRKLTEWLSADALLFEILFIGQGEEEPLAEERQLVETLLADQVQNGTVRVARLAASRLGPRCAELARRSLCHCLCAAPKPEPLNAADVNATLLALDGACPALGDDFSAPAVLEADDPMDAWGKTLEEILQRWV